MKPYALTIGFILGLASPTLVIGQGALWGVMPNGGSTGGGVIFKTNFDGTGYTEVMEFPVINPGSAPMVNPLRLPNGKLYGTTTTGGQFGKGVLYEFNPGASTYIKKVDFTYASGYAPNTPAILTLATNGKIYGTTWAGGANGRGTIFEFDPVNGAFLKRYDFPANRQCISQLTQAANGKLYGTTTNNFVPTIFEFDPVTGNVTTKYTFNGTTVGIRPVGSLTEFNGKLLGATATYYGYTPLNGALYEYDYVANTVTQRVAFTAADGTFSGKMMVGPNNKLYGAFSDNYPGSGTGAIFEYDPTAIQYSIKLNFNSATGTYPNGDFCQGAAGKLYGITLGGGASNVGTLFEYDIPSNTLTKKHDYPLSQGTAAQISGFSYDPTGILYGVCQHGGSTSSGSIYSFTIATNTKTQLLDFNQVPATGFGNRPSGKLVLANNGKLYGFTRQGGVSSGGVIFEIDPANSNVVKRFDLDPSNLGSPFMNAPNGNLYYATLNGTIEYNYVANTNTNRSGFSGGASRVGLGSNGTNRVYAYYKSVWTPSSSNPGSFGHYINLSNYGVTLNLNFPQYSNPAGSMILGPTGTFFGLTTLAGPSSYGQLYEYDPTSDSFTVRLSVPFNQAGPNHSPIIVNGKIYFTTSGGFENWPSSLHQFDPQTNNTIVTDLPEAIVGKVPNGTLALSSNDKLYSMTSSGGANGYGTLFEFDIATLTSAKIMDLTSSVNTGVDMGLTYTKAYQTILFSPVAAKTYGDSPFALTGTTSSGLTVSYSSSDPAIATVSGNIVTIVGSGTTTITASQSGNEYYNPATVVQQLLTVNKASLTVTATNASKVYGAALPSFSLTYTGFVNSESAAVIDVQPAVTTNATVCSGVSTYTLTPEGGSDNNYVFGSHTPGTLTVTRATIAAKPDPKSRQYNTPNPLLTISYTGFVCSDGPSVVDSPPVASTPATQSSNVGTYPINLSGGNDNNYIINLQPDLLTVIKANQVVTFSLVPASCGGFTFNLGNYASSSAGLPLSYSSSNSSMAYTSGSTMTFNYFGTVTATATQAGNSNYNSASAQQSVTASSGIGSITQSGDFCQQGYVTLTGGAGCCYDWAPFGQQTINVYSEGTYTVNYYDNFNCYVTGTTEVVGCGGPGGGCQQCPRTKMIQSDDESIIQLPFGIYPNPAKDQVLISLSEPAKQTCAIELYDVMGRPALSDCIESGLSQKKIQISSLEPGIYIVNIQDNKRIRQRKLIVQHN